MEVLENILYTKEASSKEWVSSKEIYYGSILETHPYLSGWRCNSMKLLRYTDQGLLKKKRFGRPWKYQLTAKGKKRLQYLWRKFGSLSFPHDPTLTAEQREVKNKLVEKKLYLNSKMDEDIKTQLEQKLKFIQAKTKGKHLWELWRARVTNHQSSPSGNIHSSNAKTQGMPKHTGGEVNQPQPETSDGNVPAGQTKKPDSEII